MSATVRSRHSRPDIISVRTQGCGLDREDRPMPKARALIGGASLGPDAPKAVGQTFDDAWEEIASRFLHDPTETEAARLMLATALLSVADDCSRDVGAMEKGALEVMSGIYGPL